MKEKSLANLLEGNYKSSELQKIIFQSEFPEKIAPKIPAQSLYLSVRASGLPSSVELLEICSLEQVSLMLDMDCWKKDRFDEERFWDWLELPDATDNIDILKRILQASDLKIVALLISRYVHTQINEEPTDQAPAPEYYTPDNGHTWVYVNISEPHRNFLMNRFMATIFEYSSELFYQLISIPQIATPTALEEESFQEKQKRLSAEGIPDLEYAHELNTPIAFSNNQKEDKSNPFIAEDINSIKPLIYNNETAGFLSDVLLKTDRSNEAEAELSLLINAAIVRWNIEVYEDSARELLIEQVKGAVDIGLELIHKETLDEPIEIFNKYGFQKIYRFGLFELQKITNTAKSINKNILKDLYESNREDFYMISGLLNDFPLVISPKTSGSDSEDVREKFDYKAIENLHSLNVLKEKISKFQ